MIRVEGLIKSFDGQEVLKRINATFERGKCSMVLGASGSGKTVLMKCMVGLYAPDRGRIYYDNQDFCALSLLGKRRIRRKIGMLFQGAALFDSMTLAENVMLPLRLYSTMSSAEMKDRVDYCLERVGLAGAHAKYPSQLSGGMKKRAGLARAIVLNPSYLFCDEPNSGLDPQTALVIDHLIKELTEDFGTVTIINTHDMNSVFEIGDVAYFLHKGVLAWQGPVSEILTADEPTLKDFIFAGTLMRRFISQ